MSAAVLPPGFEKLVLELTITIQPPDWRNSSGRFSMSLMELNRSNDSANRSSQRSAERPGAPDGGAGPDLHGVSAIRVQGRGLVRYLGTKNYAPMPPHPLPAARPFSSRCLRCRVANSRR